MGALNLLDFFILIPLAFGLIRGLFKGFVNELASVVALVGGILMAHAFADDVYALLQDYVTDPGTWTRILAYIIVFTGVVVVVFILSRAITKMLGFLALGLVNRLLGGIFGLVKVALLLLVITYFIHPFLAAQDHYDRPLFKNSVSYPYVLQYSHLLDDYFTGAEKKPFHLPDLRSDSLLQRLDTR